MQPVLHPLALHHNPRGVPRSDRADLFIRRDGFQFVRRDGKERKPPLNVSMLGYFSLLKRAWAAAAVQVSMSALLTDWS